MNWVPFQEDLIRPLRSDIFCISCQYYLEIVKTNRLGYSPALVVEVSFFVEDDSLFY